MAKNKQHERRPTIQTNDKKSKQQYNPIIHVINEDTSY
jgi:hypothetical protein